MPLTKYLPVISVPSEVLQSADWVMTLRWVLEPHIFPDNHQALAAAVKEAGQSLSWWNDAWLLDGMPNFADDMVLFHGSLGNAHHVAHQLPWHPGAFCHTQAFACSAWYPALTSHLVNQTHRFTTVRDLVENPKQVLSDWGEEAAFFVRPDSPLKPFAGRVLRTDQLSLAALDHGFYYEDVDLPIMVAPLRQLGAEWRFVVVDRQIVAGSAYQAEGRQAKAESIPAAVTSCAEKVLSDLTPPEPVFVLDICECDGELKLLELNPFSGADLYACDRRAVVDAVSAWVKQSVNPA